jgi:hypothetical protein
MMIIMTAKAASVLVMMSVLVEMREDGTKMIELLVLLLDVPVQNSRKRMKTEWTQ